MIDEILDSFKSNINKSRNPFFGTLIVTWTVRHWSLFYSILNFDKGTTLQAKKEFIREYFEYHNFYWELLYSCIYALMIISVTYILLAITRVIKKIYLNNLVPFLYTIGSKTEIKTKKDFNTLHFKYEEQKLKLFEANSSIASIKFEYEQNLKLIESLKEDLTEDLDISSIYSKILIENKKTDVFRDLANNSISKNNIHQYMDKDGTIEFLIALGLFEKASINEDAFYLNLTVRGSKTLNYILFK